MLKRVCIMSQDLKHYFRATPLIVHEIINLTNSIVDSIMFEGLKLVVIFVLERGGGVSVEALPLDILT